jgi:hypothetical protein
MSSDLFFFGSLFLGIGMFGVTTLFGILCQLIDIKEALRTIAKEK